AHRPLVLVMDILTETRQTQVQLPVEAMRRFFGVEPTVEASVTLRQIRAGRAISERVRPIVHLAHNNTHRIEIDTIRALPRPLIAVFSKVVRPRNTYACELFV